MANISAKRYVCGICGGEHIVTREGAGELYCCGKPMVIKEAETEGQEGLKGTLTQKGARYNCPVCGTQILCIKKGRVPVCCGQPMEKQLMRIDAVSE